MNASYLPYVLSGAGLTLAVAAGALLLATLLGIVAAAARLSHHRAPRALSTIYATLIRGVPDLVLMLLIFYGGQIAVNAIGQRLGWGGETYRHPWPLAALSPPGSPHQQTPPFPGHAADHVPESRH